MKRAEAIKELKDVLQSVREKPSAPHCFAHSEVLALQTIVALEGLETCQPSPERDAFARAALAGILANPTEDERFNDSEGLAIFAYRMADAMMAAREGKLEDRDARQSRGNDV